MYMFVRPHCSCDLCPRMYWIVQLNFALLWNNHSTSLCADHLKNTVSKISVTNVQPEIPQFSVSLHHQGSATLLLTLYLKAQLHCAFCCKLSVQHETPPFFIVYINCSTIRAIL